MPTLYVLCGCAFSGKSRLAEAMVDRLGGQVVSLDEIIAREGLNGGTGIAAERWAHAHQIALAELELAMQQGRPRLVLDDTSCYRFLRDDYRELAARCGYEHRLLLIDTPPGQVRARVVANRLTPQRPDIDDRVLEEHLAEFERPGSDETPEVLEGVAAIERWLRAEELGIVSRQG